MRLKLYSVSDKYISYLSKFESKIYNNKKNSRKHTRKYVGVVLEINGYNYYVPMSSPKNTDYLDKEKKFVKNSVVSIIRMVNVRDENYLYGTLRISNMIPVPISELIPYNIHEEKDINYKNVILGEIAFINKNSNLIYKNAMTLYNQKVRKKNIPYVKHSCNFSLLEEKCKKYYEEKENYCLEQSGI